MTTFLALSAFLVSAILAHLRPRIAVYLIAAALPLYTIRMHLFSLPTTLLEMLLLGGTLTILCTHMHQLKKPELRPLLWWCATFIYIGTLACVAAPHLSAALGIWKAYCIEPVLYALSLGAVLHRPHDWRILWLACISAGILIALIALAQYVTHWGIAAPWNTNADLRATAIYGFPNAVGLFLSPLTALLLSFVAGASRAKKILYITLSALCIMALFVAHADGALVSVAAVITVLLLYYKKWMVLGLGAFTLCVAILSSQTARMILTFQDTSGEVRRALWHGTLNLLMHKPLFGAGLANFPATYDQYRLASHVELLQYAHNIFLDFWAQFGILGLLWLCALIGFMTHRIITRRSSLSVTAAAVCVALLVYGLVDVPYFKNDLSVLCWMVITYVCMLPRNRTTHD